MLLELENLRVNLSQLSVDIHQQTTQKTVARLESILRDIESILLRSASLKTQDPIAFQLTTDDRRAVREAHQRLIRVMRHWNADPTAIAAAIDDTLAHMPVLPSPC